MSQRNRGRSELGVRESGDRQDAAEVEWDRLHAVVQGALQPVGRQVRKQLPDASVEAGRTTGARFGMFSYLRCRFAGEDADSLVLGVTVRPQGEGLAVSADLSGEESGHVLWKGTPVTCSRDPDSLRSAVETMLPTTGELVQVIETALADLSH
jgi:hypothetical protein